LERERDDFFEREKKERREEVEQESVESESRRKEKIISYLEPADVVEAAAAAARRCASTKVEERVGRGVKGGRLGALS